MKMSVQLHTPAALPPGKISRPARNQTPAIQPIAYCYTDSAILDLPLNIVDSQITYFKEWETADVTIFRWNLFTTVLCTWAGQNNGNTTGIVQISLLI
jgi:hypothetical protein